MARSVLIKSCLVQSLELQSSRSCPFAWEYAKVEFDSPVLKSAFCLREKPCMYFFQDPRFTPWESRAYGIIFFVPFHTSPMVTSSRGNSSRELCPLGGKGAGDTIDPWWGIEERASARIERSQESTTHSQQWTQPVPPQNLFYYFYYFLIIIIVLSLSANSFLFPPKRL